MASDTFLIRVWGARGSIPTPGPRTVKFGGNTTCVEVRCGKKLIIFDAGSGIRELGNSLIKEVPVEAKILFSHLHWDHIQGFPFFIPAFMPGNKFDLYAERKMNNRFENLMYGQMMYPHFPVSMREMAAGFTFSELDPGDIVEWDDVKIKSFAANHPDGCLTFRVEYQDKVFVFATDTEHYGCIDPILSRACRDADLCLYDATYIDDEYCGRTTTGRTGWGHSTWTEAIKLADAANVTKIVLTHHDPSHDDDFISLIEKEAAARRPGTACAYEGMTIDLLKG